MTRLKATKKLLKQNKQWDAYKKKFTHKQMRLAISKIALIFNNELTSEVLYKKEEQMLKAAKDKKENMFLEVFADFNKLTKTEKINWSEFAKYFWYVYQTSTYYKDKARGRANVFNKKNYVEMNQAKRKHYNEWIMSIDLSIDGINEKVILVQKAVF